MSWSFLTEATTYHGGKGKFCAKDSAKIVTKDGERYKVVRQHRRMKSGKVPREVAERVLRRVEVAKSRSAHLGSLLTQNWIPVTHLVGGG